MERDDTQDWLLPPGARPPTVSELETRIDEALVVARASEEAVRVVGDAAIDAARQARRAADLAVRATAIAAEARRDPDREDASLRRFRERADRVMSRLRALDRGPHRDRLPSGRAGDRR